MTPLPFGAVRPLGWAAAQLKTTWEQGLEEGSPAWVRHALMVGEGKGRLLVRAWEKRTGNAAASLLPLAESDADALWQAARAGERGLDEVLAVQCATDPEGLRLVFYAPARIKTEVTGVPVELEVETESFDALRVEVRLYPETPLEFTLFFRLPGWTHACMVTGDGAAGGELTDQDGWLALRRTWNRGDTLTLAFETEEPQ